MHDGAFLLGISRVGIYLLIVENNHSPIIMWETLGA